MGAYKTRLDKTLKLLHCDQSRVNRVGLKRARFHLYQPVTKKKKKKC